MPSGNVPPPPAGPLIGRAAELSRVRELDGRTEAVWVDPSSRRDPAQVRSEVSRAELLASVLTG